MTRKPSSSNMAAMPWAPRKPPRRSRATSCCWSRPQSIPWWCMAAGRRSRRCSSGSASSRNSPQACASPMPPPSRSSRWCWRARSTSSSSATSTRPAVGLSGKDGSMVKASKTKRTMVDPDSNIEKAIDLGFVGDPEKVDLTLLNQLIGHELIPVLAPLATSHDGQTLNVNADTFAGAVAGALKAKRLLLLTDVPGVLDKSKKLIPELSVKDARKLIADGTISGGMIPKVETCIYALEQGVQGVVIIDGKTQHAVLLELFTNQGTGTLIHK